MTTKTLEDYKNSVKILKIKIIKLQKQNDDLMDIKNKHASQLDFLFDTKTTPSTLDSMREFSRGSKRIGLTPEMVFRAADQQQLGVVSTVSMQQLLLRLRLNLNQTQITNLTLLFDMDSSGTITTQEYMDSLEAYGINSESLGDRASFPQISFIKFAKLTYTNNLDGVVGYNKMDPNKLGSFRLEIFQIFIKNMRDWTQYMTEREIIGAYNYLDIGQNQRVGQAYYLSEMGKTIKGKVLVVSKTKQETSQEVQRIEKIKKVQENLKRMAVLGINFNEFIAVVLQNIQNPYQGIFIEDFFRAAKEIKLRINKTEVIGLFQLVDMGENGSIDYDELMVFFMWIKTPKDSFDLLIIILCRKLQALNYTILDYLSVQSIHDDMNMDIEQFYPVSKVLFNTPNEIVAQELFKAMDKDNSGTVSTKEIIDMINQTLKSQNSDMYKSVLIPQSQNVGVQKTLKSPQFLDQSQFFGSSKILIKSKIFSTQQTKTLDQLAVDPIQLSQQINKIKPSLVAADYFPKYEINREGKLAELGTWFTIFNSELACLKRAQEIIQDLEKSKDQRWVDPEFGPSVEDPFGAKSMYIADSSIPPGCPDPEDVKWLRPEEIIQEQQGEEQQGNIPQMFYDEGPIANDVMQSQFLGDCWFISALSIIAGQNKYLRGHYIPKDKLSDKDIAEMSMGVYPPLFQFLNKYRIYVFRFFKNFQWRYVMIDDRICCRSGEIIYAKCRDPSEIWVQMIEKAYAKLHNCYQALGSGDVAQGLADMTGYVADRIDIKSFKSAEETEKLWSLLQKVKLQHIMMGCSATGQTEGEIQLDGQICGILSGHAYGVVDILELKDSTCKNKHKSHRLLRLRNPWGYKEWNLKWSDYDDYDQLTKFETQIKQYYDEETKKALKSGDQPPLPFVKDDNDGTFIINFKSWRGVFNNLFMNVDFPDVWSGLRAIDSFREDSAGPPKKDPKTHEVYAKSNAQFILTVNNLRSKDTSIFISLGQDDGRLINKEIYPFGDFMNSVLLCVYKLDKNETSLPKYDPKRMSFNSKLFSSRREINSGEFKVQNGSYSIIPCTQQPGQTGAFILSVYFDCPKTCITLQKYNDPQVKFSIIQEEEETSPAASNEIKIFLNQIVT